MTWGVFVEQAIAEGRLLRLFGAALDDGTGYHLVMTEIAAGRSTVMAFSTWLRRTLSGAGHDAPPPIRP